MFRGTKQQLPMISFDTISNMGLTIDNDREDLVSVISVLYHITNYTSTSLSGIPRSYSPEKANYQTIIEGITISTS